MLNYVAYIEIQKVAKFNAGRKKNQFNSKQIIQILQTIPNKKQTFDLLKLGKYDFK